MKTLLLFYNKYCDYLSRDVSDKIIFMMDNQDNISQKEIIKKIVESFFKLFNEKLNITIGERLSNIKTNISTINMDDYENLLNDETSIIVNQISNYCNESINSLISELKEFVSTHQTYLNDYLTGIIGLKLIDTLKDKLKYSIKLINNNYGENTAVLQRINEKTLK